MVWVQSLSRAGGAALSTLGWPGGAALPQAWAAQRPATGTDWGGLAATRAAKSNAARLQARRLTGEGGGVLLSGDTAASRAR